MSKSGLRWADSSSDESESEDEFAHVVQHAGLNDGSIGVFNEVSCFFSNGRFYHGNYSHMHEYRNYFSPISFH